MNWTKSEDQEPPKDTDILGAWFLGEWESHVVYCSSQDGKWRRQCDHSDEDFARPEIWMPIPIAAPPDWWVAAQAAKSI